MVVTQVSGTTSQRVQQPLAVPAAILVAGLTAGVVAQGGYYLPGRLLVLALVVVAAGSTVKLRQLAHPVPIAGAALALWALLRDPTPEAAAAAATLAGLAGAFLVVRQMSAAARERCADAVIAVGALVAVTAWAGVAWRLPMLAVLVEGKLWRGGSTLTYPNAAAAFLVPVALLAIARPSTLSRKLIVYLLLAGVGAALSRAGFIALFVGLVVLAVRTGVKPTLERAASPMIGAGIALAALASSFPASGPPHPAVAAAGLLAGGVVAVGGARIAVLLVAALVLAVQPDTAALAGRANLSSWGRSEAARAALDLVAEHPLIGAGVGQARFVWDLPDGNGEIALYAHNEYLQLLVDLGAIGVVLLLVLLAATVVTVKRGWSSPHAAAATAGLVALAVHSGFDFLWHIPVLPLLAGLLIGLAAMSPTDKDAPAAPSRSEEEKPNQPRGAP